MQQLSTRQIMNRIYKDICGFEISRTEEKKVRESKGSPVYGEITLASTVKLFDHLGLTSQDTLYDLGSGVGKLILYAALFTSVRRAVGVELSKTRHTDSITALKRALLFGQISERCTFFNDDLLRVNLSDATVIYTCSTAFSMDFMRKLTAHVSRFSQAYKLVTLQDLPNERSFHLIDRLKLDMTWQRNATVHIYQRR
jgi:hypothetical protein